MKKSKNRLLAPGSQLPFLFLALFAVVTALLGQYALAGAEAVVAAACFVAARREDRRRRQDIVTFMNALNGDMDVAAKDAMVNSPPPAGGGR